MSSMRITESIRNAFVRAVMQDIPRVDYREQMQKIVQDYFLNKAPDIIKRARKAHPQYFPIQQVHVSVVYSVSSGRSYTTNINFHVYLSDLDDGYIKDKDLEAKIQALYDKEGEQNTARGEMEQKLNATIRGYSTVKTAKEALPELAKYLPDETAPPSRSVPALANLMADLTKAGWPKDKQPEPETAEA
jgi:hypothetical protein